MTGGDLLRRLAVRSAIPSGGWDDRGREVRLLALLAVRNEADLLPGWLANVSPHVDGIVALDDGSTDGSAELLAAHPRVLFLSRVPSSRPNWDEVANFRTLVAAAHSHDAQWMLALDADERLEHEFRRRAERVIRRGDRIGLRAFALRLFDLWDSPNHYRIDGRWGSKTVPRLFRAPSGHDTFDNRPLHGAKAPLGGRVGGRFVVADLRLYHLRMISAEARVARRARYEALDPGHRWQSIGYDYLTDERNLRLRRVPTKRGFES